MKFHNLRQYSCVGRALLLVRNSSTNTKPTFGPPPELAHQNGLWSEFGYSGGVEIFGQAEPADYVYRVRDGAVRTHKLLPDGRRQIGAFHLPGDIFGAENDEVHRFTAEAIVDTTVWVARRRSLFAGLGRGDLTTAKHVRDLIAVSLEHVENHLLLLGRQNALERVAAFLAEMDRRLGQPPIMVLPMCRLDIADYLGLTLETVSRAISKLRNEGIISFVVEKPRDIVLRDRQRLRQLANFK